MAVARNGQALLGMPDTAVLKIININIDSIQTVKEECNTNIGDAKESNTKQEVHVVEESCTNMDADLKIDNNVNGHNYTNVICQPIISYHHQLLRQTKGKASS